LRRRRRDPVAPKSFPLSGFVTDICALRRLDLYADPKEDRGQYRKRHCGFPRGGLHVSGHSRSVGCQLERGQYARFLRAAGTGSNLVELSAQTGHSAGAYQNWVPTLPEAAAPLEFSSKSLNLGSQFVQCFSFSCDSETYINNVPVVTCHGAIGASLMGTSVAPHTSFLTQTGQLDQDFCAEHLVAGSLQTPNDLSIWRSRHRVCSGCYSLSGAPEWPRK
jgi:hypothetical protein